METDGERQTMDWMVCYSNSGDIGIIDCLEEKRGQCEQTGLWDYFVPLELHRIYVDDKLIERNQLIAGNYIFLKATNDDIMRLRQEPPFDATLRFLHPQGEPLGCIYVEDRQIQTMRTTVERMGGEVEYFVPSPKELAIADTVRIIGGKFKGIEGVLESVKGHEGGRVIIPAADVLAVCTPKIDVEDIQLVRLATVTETPSGSYTSRAYKKVHSFSGESRRLLEEKEQSGTLSPESARRARMLVRRFSELKLNGKIRVMHAEAIANLLQALGETDTELYAKFKGMLP